MYQSHVALKPETREKLSSMLNVALGSTIDLRYQVKQAHWNIKGEQFFARHELFDQLQEKLTDLTDDIAERASTLGAYAEGTIRAAAKHSVLEEYPREAEEGRAHIEALVQRYAKYTGALRELVGEVQKLEDVVTEDLLTETLRKTELDLWFLESHLIRGKSS